MQYAALQHMFAQVAGLKVGTLTHNIGDCHIYDRHIPLVKKLIEAESIDVHPKLLIKNSTKNFYDFKVEDFEIEGYTYNKDIKLGKIPVAKWNKRDRSFCFIIGLKCWESNKRQNKEMKQKRPVPFVSKMEEIWIIDKNTLEILVLLHT